MTSSPHELTQTKNLQASSSLSDLASARKAISSGVGTQNDAELVDEKAGGGIGSIPDPDSQQRQEHDIASVDANNIPLPMQKMDDQPYSVFTHNEKKIIATLAGICAFVSPVSGQIYFPSLDVIASDLKGSSTMINLTITVYLIVQGIAPAFIGGFSDASGRKTAYLICFVIYMAANIGMALQNDYAALMVLRCLQAAGGSGTVALATAVVSDIVTSQERGVYVSYMSVAPQAGPSIGPIIGGLLGQYLGWHSIFWFLVICTGVILIPVILFFPETCRSVVDNGSVPPPGWLRCYMNTKVEARLIADGKTIDYDKRADFARRRVTRIPNPLETVKIVFTKEAGFALGYIGLLCCSYYATIALIPNQFGQVYGFNQIQIALCYLPLGCGSLLAAFVRGRIMDARYRYHAKHLDLPLQSNRRVDITDFPIERVRLEVAIPTLALASAFIIGFGWMIQYKVNLAGPLIFLFVIGFCVSASISTVSVLLVDIYPGKAGTATAANNFVRCLLGAGATSAVIPLIEKIGIGWTTSFFALLFTVSSPILWYIMDNGPSWRRASKEKRERKDADHAAKANVSGEKGSV